MPRQAAGMAKNQKQTPPPTRAAAAAARKKPALRVVGLRTGSGISKPDVKKTAGKKKAPALGRQTQSKTELAKLQRLDEERHRLLQQLKRNAAERGKIEAAGAARKKKADGGAAGASRGAHKKTPAPVRACSCVLLALTLDPICLHAHGACPFGACPNDLIIRCDSRPGVRAAGGQEPPDESVDR